MMKKKSQIISFEKKKLTNLMIFLFLFYKMTLLPKKKTEIFPLKK